MSDDPTPEPQQAPEKAAAEAAPEGATEGEAAPHKPFLLHFPRAPIPGTELTIRSPSVGQASAMWKDVASEELDDREFTVHLVHRQLDQDPPIEEVRAWPDEQLLAAADAYLSLDTTEPDLDDEEQADREAESTDQDDGGQAVDEADAEPEPLSFADFRDEIRQQGLRRGRQLKRMMSGILALSQGNAKKIAELMKVDPSLVRFKALDIFKGLDLTKIGAAAGMDAFKNLDLAKLTGTSKIGETLSKMLADTQAMEKFTPSPMELYVPHFPPIEPLPYIELIERPDVHLLEDVGETLEKMHDNQARIAKDQIDVMVQQANLIKDQGVALAALVNDAKGQKWNRRAMLASTILMTIAAVATVLYAGSIIRPFGAATPATPAPIVSPSLVTPSPTIAPTKSAAP